MSQEIDLRVHFHEPLRVIVDNSISQEDQRLLDAILERARLITRKLERLDAQTTLHYSSVINPKPTNRKET